jgi:hypothetical protein
VTASSRSAVSSASARAWCSAWWRRHDQSGFRHGHSHSAALLACGWALPPRAASPQGPLTIDFPSALLVGESESDLPP